MLKKMYDHQQKRSRSLSWSDLPQKFIHNLSKQLKTKHDIAYFRGVCKKWRKYSVNLPNNTLSPLLPRTIPILSSHSCSSFLVSHYLTKSLVQQVSSIYLITPSKLVPLSYRPWLVMVGESEPGKLCCFHCLTGKRVKYSPPVLDLTRFHVSELVEGYSLEHSRNVHRVFLCSDSVHPLEAMVLYNKGSLAKITVNEINQDDDTVEEEEEKDECFIQWSRFKVRKENILLLLYLDDVVSLKGMVCGVDRRGKLYSLDKIKMAVKSTLVTREVNWGNQMTGRRKRLVVDPKTNKLHLIVREHVQKKVRFKVYKLDEDRRRWVLVDSLGNDRVLFVGRTHCFFANVGCFPGCHSIIGNSIVFVANCFTQYCGRDFPDESLFDDEDEDIGVYRYGERDNFYTISLFPEFSEMLWPQPLWFEPFCLKRELDDDNEEEMHLELDTSAKKTSSYSDEDDDDSEQQESDSGSSVRKTLSSSDEDYEENSNTDFLDKHLHQSQYEGEATADEPVSLVQTVITEHRRCIQKNFNQSVVRTPEMDYQFHDKGPPKQKVPVSPLVNPCTDEMPSGETCTQMVKFQGVDVKSYHVPTLKTIWARHGNLIGDNTVRNKSLLSCALESLANMVITLQNSTARNLTDAQAEELRSNAVDLQRVGLKVDWLIPVIDKASTFQKNKAVIESIIALDKVKIEIEERERAFLAETAKKKKEVEDRKASLSAKISFPEPIDMDECLGLGLF